MDNAKEKKIKLFDVIIIGSGVAGIGASYWLQKKCPEKKFIILEARNTLGGTWDLFRYPGIRSDSDMFTFGFRFKPWQNPQSLSDGESILKYLKEVATENRIDKKIQFGHKLVRASWSGENRLWTLEVLSQQVTKFYYCKFIYFCSGYYNYEEAYRPYFEGEENFNGTIVIPQFWPKDLDYSGKRVIVVGSGATAVTLVPAVAEQVEHVTMLQRSPTYVVNLPNKDKLFYRLKKWLPEKTAFRITRARNILLALGFYWLARTFPVTIKKLIISAASRQLGKDFEVEKHFKPTYNPWDQRLCVIPDNDLFKAIKKGKASVITDEISRFTEKGIHLKSGEELHADIIVLATGLKLKVLGGTEVIVDGKKINPNSVMVYKGMLISDVPNLALAFGYTNASWTLKTDLTANYVCKLLNYMDKKKYSVVIPKKDPTVEELPFVNLQSGYIHRADPILPRQGSRRPWRVYQNYIKDMFATRYGRIKDKILQFYPSKGKF